MTMYAGCGTDSYLGLGIGCYFWTYIIQKDKLGSIASCKINIIRLYFAQKDNSDLGSISSI